MRKITPIYFITNRKLVNEKRYFEVIKEASRFNNIKIILREKDLSDEEYKKLYYKIKKIAPNTEIIINSKLTVFKDVKEGTIQLSFQDFMKLGDVNYNIGVSVHSIEEGIIANKRGAKYILVSHIYKTKCKEGLEPKGIQLIKELKSKVTCKVIALGGINTENYREVIEAGADGISIMSLLFLSSDITKDIKKLC